MPNQKLNKQVGSKGERRVAAFLVAQGYRVLQTNLRIAGGEIDILAADEAGTLVVVEVKTRQSTSFAKPQANITPVKLATLHRLARAVADKYPDSNVRVDVAEYDLATNHINYLTDILN